MKNTLKSVAGFALASLFATGLAFAAATKSEPAVESKVAGCCAKAEKEGHACTHPCCVEAAKAGNNCTKCKGSGPIVKK